MIALLGIATVLALLAVVGSLRDSHVVTVTRTTTASRDVIWNLWADVDGRPRWDKGLESIDINGPFTRGAAGTVKVEGQGAIGYEVIAVNPKSSYTDRFNSLPATHTDWHHTITPRPDGRFDVTWTLETRGPLSLMSLPVLKSIFGKEIPTAVDDFVELAEAQTPR